MSRKSDRTQFISRWKVADETKMNGILVEPNRTNWVVKAVFGWSRRTKRVVKAVFGWSRRTKRVVKAVFGWSRRTKRVVKAVFGWSRRSLAVWWYPLARSRA